MSVESQMRRHGFAPWRSLHGAQGFQKVFRKGSVHSVVVMPVNAKQILSGSEKVLACHFDKQNQMRADRFYDSLHSFLQSHQLGTSLLAAESASGQHGIQNAGLASRVLNICTGFMALLRKGLLFAR